jgi:glycosyltransferase involved in cell wall biosynthesis
MRITHVIRSDSFAGVERYVCTAARRQDEFGHDVVVIGGNAERMTEALTTTSVQWRPATTVRVARRQLRSTRSADVVHAHMTAGELAAATMLSSSKVVSTRHFASRRGASLVGRGVAGLIAGRIAAQIAISTFVAEAVEGASTVVHPGTRDVRPWVPAANRDRVVLVAQRLEPEKRTDLALRIWARSNLAGDGWRLQIAGSGAEEATLRALAIGLGVEDSCDFLGACVDVADRLMSAGVLMAPRHDEPYGLSVVEAMAAGLPVVAGAGGGHDETVGSCPGAVLLPIGEPIAGGRLLRNLALDVDRRDAYGAQLRVVQRERFSAEAQVDALTAVYRRALDQ